MKQRIYYCPVEATLDVIGGKWKVSILWHIKESKIIRFGDLKRQITGITQKMLTQQLRELERDKVINRKVYKQVPPKVEYTLTEYGKTLDKLLEMLSEWGLEHINKVDAKWVKHEHI